MEEPVHVTVQMATLEQAVEVSCVWYESHCACLSGLTCELSQGMNMNYCTYKSLKCTHSFMVIHLDNNTISVCPSLQI